MTPLERNSSLRQPVVGAEPVSIPPPAVSHQQIRGPIVYQLKSDLLTLKQVIPVQNPKRMIRPSVNLVNPRLDKKWNPNDPNNDKPDGEEFVAPDVDGGYEEPAETPANVPVTTTEPANLPPEKQRAMPAVVTPGQPSTRPRPF